MFVVIQSQGFVVVVSGFVSVQLDGLFEPFQSVVVLLIFEVTESQIVLGRGIVFDYFTGLG